MPDDTTYRIRSTLTIRPKENDLDAFILPRGRPHPVVVTALHRYWKMMTRNVPTLDADVAVAVFEALPETRRDRDPTPIILGYMHDLGVTQIEAYALLDALERARGLLEQAECDDVVDALTVVGVVMASEE